MRLQFVKHTKDEREPIIHEHNGLRADGYYQTKYIENYTYYTSCYICDTDLYTLNTDEKYLLSLLNRKAKEMNGDGIVGYIKAVNIGTLVKLLKDFKPYQLETYDRKSENVIINGTPTEHNTTVKTVAYNQIKIAFKHGGKYEYIDLNHTLYNNDRMKEWLEKKDSEKFYTHDFVELEKNLWKALYRLKAKGLVDERYVNGYVKGGGRKRYSGVKAKRFYTINEKGIEYLQTLK